MYGGHVVYLHLLLRNAFVKLAFALHASVERDLLQRKWEDELRIINQNLSNLVELEGSL